MARNNTFRNVLSSSKGGKFKFKKKKMDGLATEQILWVQKNLLCDKRLVAFWPATRLKKTRVIYRYLCGVQCGSSAVVFMCVKKMDVKNEHVCTRLESILFLFCCLSFFRND